MAARQRYQRGAGARVIINKARGLSMIKGETGVI